MNKTYWLRSIIFNIAFFAVTSLCCIAFLPAIFLSQKKILWCVRFYLHAVMWIEENILGLELELRGLENLPEGQPFIVAAKHQSTYETLKLHLMFYHPAIILKRELTKIPLWGKFLQKTDIIAIDRSSAATAIESMTSGAKRVMAQSRPIVIFPQGTRVSIDDTVKNKPYKSGIARIYEATKTLPVVPMAINAGYFWPRGSWLKRPGTAIFEFLPPIPPGLEKKAFMDDLQNKLELHSTKLAGEARENADNVKPKSAFFAWLALIFVGAFSIYSLLWNYTAEEILLHYQNAFEGSASITRTHTPITVGGFPGPVTLSVKTDGLAIDGTDIVAENLKISLWPVPWSDAKATASALLVKQKKWSGPLRFNDAQMIANKSGNELYIKKLELHQDGFKAEARGTFTKNEAQAPDLKSEIVIHHPDKMIDNLRELKILDQRSESFIRNALILFRRENRIEFPLSIRGGAIYADPILIGEVPEFGNTATE